MLSNSDLEDMYETLNTHGWDLLVETFAVQFEGCNQVVGCAAPKDMWYRQGQLAILQQLLVLKEDINEQLHESKGITQDADI